MRRLLVSVAALGVLASPGAAQERAETGGPTRVWSGRVAPGAWLRVHDVKGRIRVEAATGDVAEVLAEVRGEREDITFDIVESGADAVLCALWPGQGECTAEGPTGDHDEDSFRAAAHLTVRLPRGVKVLAASGNGDISVRDATADVIARSGNGDVEVQGAGGPVRVSSGNGDVDVRDAGGQVSASTGNGEVAISTSGGVARASSGNGDVEVRMAALPGDSDMDFRTGNGTVTVTLPANFQGELDAHTGSGEVQTDFPVMVRGVLKKNRLRGTIGSGGRRLRMSSGNGDIELRRID